MFFSRVRLKPEFYKSTRLAKVLCDNSYNMHRLLWDLFTAEKHRNFLYREEIAREQLGVQASVRGEPIYYVVSLTPPSFGSPIFQVDSREYRPKLQQGDKLRFELRANPVVNQKRERDNPELYLSERRKRDVADKEKLTKKRIRHDIVMDAQRTLLTSLCAELSLLSFLPSVPKKQEYKKALLTHGGQALDERLTTILKENFLSTERLRQSMQLHDKLEWSLKATIDVALEKWLVTQGAKCGFSLLQDNNGQHKLQNSAYRWQSIKADKDKKSGFSSVDFTGELEVTDVEEFTKALFRGVGRAKAFGCGLVLVKRI